MIIAGYNRFERCEDMWTRLQHFFVRRLDKVVVIKAGADSPEAARPTLRFPAWRTGRIVLAVFLVVFVFCGGVYGFNEAALYGAKRQLDDARNRGELLRPMQAKKLQADAKLEAISQKQTILNNLTKERLSCYAVLAGLTAKTPAQLRLTDLEVDKGLLKIGGMTSSSSELALFIERLKQDATLTEPTVVLTANQFQMTVRVRER